MFCAVYILYNIIPKIHIQNTSVLCVISHKTAVFDHFHPFLTIGDGFRSISTVPGPNRCRPVLASCSCRLPIFRPKNGPDQTYEH